jgi:hypothetical protein
MTHYFLSFLIGLNLRVKFGHHYEFYLKFQFSFSFIISIDYYFNYINIKHKYLNLIFDFQFIKNYNFQD